MKDAIHKLEVLLALETLESNEENFLNSDMSDPVLRSNRKKELIEEVISLLWTES